jgi:predicted metal-binding membrane protein
MCGQTWSGVAASFLGMWIVMMVAMMLPSLLPTLWRYRAAAMKIPVSVAAMLTTLGYFAVWTALGAGVFLAGATLAALAMQLPALSRAVPVASSFVVLCGGVFQFSAWKARLLSSCRHSPEFDAGWQASAGAAGRLGLRLGCRCTGSCAGFTAMLLVGGVMDMRVMAVVGAAITAERLAPSALRVPQAIGVVAIVLGLISLSLT